LIIKKERLKELPNLFEFHHPEHQELSMFFLEKIAARLDFKLKIQRASIQLMNPHPFAVIGLRQSQSFIFIEFYNEVEVESKRVVKTLEGKNECIVNRVEIVHTNEIDSELLDFVVHSNSLLN
jgi:hypothetical protein